MSDREGAMRLGEEVSALEAERDGLRAERDDEQNARMCAETLAVEQFDVEYRTRMISAYPIIAGMTADEMYYATPVERDAAFERILANRNLRRTHEMYLEDR